MEWGKAVKHEGGGEGAVVSSSNPNGYKVVYAVLRDGMSMMSASTKGDPFSTYYFKTNNEAAKKAAFHLMASACERHHATS